MKRRLVVLVTGVLVVVVFLIAGIVVAEEIITRYGLWWSDPDWETTWLKLESEEPITATFTGTLHVRRPASGEIISRQNFETTCLPGEEPGAGRCGGLEQIIDTNQFEREDLELWSRACWMVTGYVEPLCTIYVPPGCDLAGAGCTMILSETGITIPDACRTAIEACGTVQDDQGFWYIRTFRGTKPYGICIPGLMLWEE